MLFKKVFALQFFLISTTISFAQSNLHNFDYIDTITTYNKKLAALHTLFAKTPNNTIQQIELFSKMGDSYNKSFKYDSAIVCFNKALLLSTKLKTEIEMANLFKMKGASYYYLYNLDNAIACWMEALPWAEKFKQFKLQYIIKSNLGATYIDKCGVEKTNKYHDSAGKYLKQSMNEIRDVDSLTTPQGLLTTRIYGTYFHILGQYDKAEKIYAEVLAKCRVSKNSEQAFTGVLNMYADILSRQGKKQQALALVNEAIAFDSSNKLIKNKTMFLGLKASIYKNAKQFDSAYYYINDAYTTQEKTYTNQAKEDIANAEASYKNELLKRDLKIEADKKTKLVLIATLISIGLLLSWISFYFYQKRKTALEKKKQAELSLHAFIDGEEKERSRLSRDLHDGIVQELLALKFDMKANHIDESIITKLEKINDEIRNISHQLMPYTLKELGLVAAIDDACQKLCSHSSIQYSFNHALTNERLLEKIEISLYRIFQELLNNIIKHSKATEINVQLIERNGFVNLIVEDNGIGFSTTTNTLKGIGLENIKSRINLINGKLNFESTENDGTIAIVRIPL